MFSISFESADNIVSFGPFTSELKYDQTSVFALQDRYYININMPRESVQHAYVYTWDFTNRRKWKFKACNDDVSGTGVFEVLDSHFDTFTRTIKLHVNLSFIPLIKTPWKEEGF